MIQRHPALIINRPHILGILPLPVYHVVTIAHVAAFVSLQRF